MRILALLLALSGCSEAMLADALAGGEARCEQAQTIYDDLQTKTAGTTALAIAACVR